MVQKKLEEKAAAEKAKEEELARLKLEEDACKKYLGKKVQEFESYKDEMNLKLREQQDAGDEGERGTYWFGKQ